MSNIGPQRTSVWLTFLATQLYSIQEINKQNLSIPSCLTPKKYSMVLSLKKKKKMAYGDNVTAKIAWFTSTRGSSVLHEEQGVAKKLCSCLSDVNRINLL